MKRDQRAVAVAAAGLTGTLAGVPGASLLATLVSELTRAGFPSDTQLLKRARQALGGVGGELTVDSDAVTSACAGLKAAMAAVGPSRVRTDAVQYPDQLVAELNRSPHRPADDLDGRLYSVLAGQIVAELGRLAGHPKIQPLLAVQTVRDTGDLLDATAATHGLLADLHARQAGPPLLFTLGAYWDEVAAFSPPQLLDRDAEVAAVFAFATDDRPERQPWWVWRAPLGAGKTGLLATLATQPALLPGVSTVPFLINRDQTGRNDWAAFLARTLPALAHLADQSPPAAAEVSGAVRGRTMLAHLLTQAAAAQAQRGRHILILLDGLDEDPFHIDKSVPSVVSMLPSTLPPNISVLIATRPNPPLPTDLDSRHPLRNITNWHKLDASPHAADAIDPVDLDLMMANPAGCHLAGFLAAANGPLTAGNLCELLQHLENPAAAQVTLTAINDLLTRRTGRTLLPFSIPGGLQPGYRLGHETLVVQTIQRIQPALADQSPDTNSGEWPATRAEALRGYRAAIDSWADSYATRAWPAETPNYLLSDYFGLVESASQLDRLYSLASASARHDRMIVLSGSDAAGSLEVARCQQQFLKSHEGSGRDMPLADMTMLALESERLRGRSKQIPATLPAIMGAAGQIITAINLVNAMEDPLQQLRNFVEVAQVLDRRRDRDDVVKQLLDMAVSIKLPESDLWQWEPSNEDAVKFLVLKGFDSNALALADRFPTSKTSALRTFADICASGDRARIFGVLEEISRRISRLPEEQKTEQVFFLPGLAVRDHLHALQVAAYVLVGDELGARTAEAAISAEASAQCLAIVADILSRAAQEKAACEYARRSEELLPPDEFGMRFLRWMSDAVEGLALTYARGGQATDCLRILRDFRPHLGWKDFRTDHGRINGALCEVIRTIAERGDGDWVKSVAELAEGELDRAETLAFGARILNNWGTPTESLASDTVQLLEAVRASQPHEPERAWTEPARGYFHSPFDMGERDWRSFSRAAAQAASDLAWAGHFTEAERIVDMVGEGSDWSNALADVALADAAIGSKDLVVSAVETLTARNSARTNRSSFVPAAQLSIALLLKARDSEAYGLLDLSISHTSKPLLTPALLHAVEVLASRRPDEVQRFVSQISEATRGRRMCSDGALGSVALAMAKQGEVETAERLVQAIRGHSQRMAVLADCAQACVTTGQVRQARNMAQEAADILRADLERGNHPMFVFGSHRVAVAVAVSGDPKGAWSLCESIGQGRVDQDAGCAVVEALVEVGDMGYAHHLAVRLSRSLTAKRVDGFLYSVPDEQLSAMWLRVAAGWAVRGQPGWMKQAMVQSAEREPSQGFSPYFEGHLVFLRAELAAAMLRGSLRDDAKHLLTDLDHKFRTAWSRNANLDLTLKAVLVVVRALRTAGEYAQANAFADLAASRRRQDPASVPPIPLAQVLLAAGRIAEAADLVTKNKGTIGEVDGYSSDVADLLSRLGLSDVSLELDQRQQATLARKLGQIDWHTALSQMTGHPEVVSMVAETMGYDLI